MVASDANSAVAPWSAWSASLDTSVCGLGMTSIALLAVVSSFGTSGGVVHGVVKVVACNPTMPSYNMPCVEGSWVTIASFGEVDMLTSDKCLCLLELVECADTS